MGDEHADVPRESLAFFARELMEVEVVGQIAAGLHEKSAELLTTHPDAAILQSFPRRRCDPRRLAAGGDRRGPRALPRRRHAARRGRPGAGDPPERLPRELEPARHLDASRPGELLQLDWFCKGRLPAAKGTVRQRTAIDVASSYVWAELHLSERNPGAEHASAPAQLVAGELRAAGWRLERVLCDNASGFRSAAFGETLRRLGALRSFIAAGRPPSNGCVERVQRTILEECWKPALARALIPRYTGLRRDLERDLRYCNCDPAHAGRRKRGRTPAEVLGKAKGYV